MNDGLCIRVCCGRREAILWVDPETKDYRVVHCNWFKECIKRGVLLNGHCPPYCDLIASAKLYLRGRKRRNVDAKMLPAEECEIVNAYNPRELIEAKYSGEIDNFERFDEFV